MGLGDELRGGSSEPGAGPDGLRTGPGEPGVPGDAPTRTVERPPGMEYIFMNADGLRAGWGLAIFFGLLALIVAIAGGIFYALNPHAAQMMSESRSEPLAAWKMVISEGIAFAVVAGITWVMSRIEDRPMGVYGFGGGGRVRYFSVGLAWGFGFLTVEVLVLWKLGLLVFTGQEIFGMAAVRSGAVWALGFLFVGLFEESMFRGYLQYTLARGLAGLYGMGLAARYRRALGFWTAVVVMSLFFCFEHVSNPGESPVGLVSVCLVGVVFSVSLWRTGSLWWALGFHAAWDWAQSFVYGVADSGMIAQGRLIGTHPVGSVLLSGGATGPEGSLVVVPVLVVAAGVAWWTLPVGRIEGKGDAA